MTPQQRRRFISWACLSVGLPVSTYIGVYALSWLIGIPVSMTTVLARGDLLLLAIGMLAFGVDATIHHLLMTPRTRADFETRNFLFVGIALLFLIMTAVVYGGILVYTESPANLAGGMCPRTRATLFVCWLIFVTGGIGLQYNLLLRTGTI